MSAATPLMVLAAGSIAHMPQDVLASAATRLYSCGSPRLTQVKSNYSLTDDSPMIVLIPLWTSEMPSAFSNSDSR